MIRCSHCSRAFSPERSTARYCTTRCRVAAHRGQRPSLTVGSLFSGIGGLDLGFQWAGFRIAWQVELGEDERAVLAHRWPTLPRHDDISTFPRSPTPTFPSVDVLIGGFPCQDISRLARLDHGKQEGIEGKESGLVREMLRVVEGFRPRAVVIENVRSLLSSNGGRDFALILRSLDDLGYMGEWKVLSARGEGLPHLRQRLFVLAYSDIAKGRIEREWRLRESKGVDWERIVHPSRDGTANGIPGILDRLPRVVRRSWRRRRRMIGNAVVVPVAETVARRVLDVLR